jgi:hypothetical protein
MKLFSFLPSNSYFQILVRHLTFLLTLFHFSTNNQQQVANRQLPVASRKPPIASR